MNWESRPDKWGVGPRKLCRVQQNWCRIYHCEDAPNRRPAWYRKLLSGFANRVYVPLLLGLPLHDATIFFPDRVRGDSKMSLSIQLESAWQAPAMRFRHSNRNVRR